MRKKLFILYVLALILLIGFKFKGSLNEVFDRVESINRNRTLGVWNYNFNFFESLKTQMQYLGNGRWALINILANIIFFIPLGGMNYFLLDGRKKVKQVFLLCFLFVIAIETIQFVLMVGYFDVDDIILNMIGCSIGIVFFEFVLARKNNSTL